MSKWEISVHGKRPPRPGEGHWSRLHKSKKQWTDYLGWIMKQRKIPPCEPGEKRKITITFFRPGPVSDKDNAYSACKVPLDALKRCGLIEDDSPRHIDLEAYTVSARPSRTVVLIERI